MRPTHRSLLTRTGGPSQNAASMSRVDRPQANKQLEGACVPGHVLPMEVCRAEEQLIAFGLAFATVLTLGLAPVLYAAILRVPSPSLR